MAGERIKIVVWDSIGNTLLGVRPWTSWDGCPAGDACYARTRQVRRTLRLDELFDEYDVELIWFDSADNAYASLRLAAQ